MKLITSDDSLNSFFTGIGGFDYAFEDAGFRPSFQCEIHQFCISVLKRHWPKTTLAPDIRDLSPYSLPNAKIWCGGFPCQDVSVARGWLGRPGLKGKNTGLFHPFSELIRACSPELLILENVTGLLSAHRGMDFHLILQFLCDLGYAATWRILNTRYFGAPQSRPRIYICAWKNSPLLALQALFEEGIVPKPENPRMGFLEKCNGRRNDACVPAVAYCLAATSGRHTGTDWSRSYVSYPNAVRRLSPLECERLQGFPDGWSLPSDDYHLNSDEVDTLRYHALGNAVSVPVVKWLANRIKLVLASVRRPKSSSGFWETVDSIGEYSPHLSIRDSVHFKLSKVAKSQAAIKWESAGIMFDDTIIMSPVPPSPTLPIDSRFIDLIENGHLQSHYYLSPNAAKGILRRVDSQGRTLFHPLRESLERLSQLAESR